MFFITAIAPIRQEISPTSSAVSTRFIHAYPIYSATKIDKISYIQSFWYRKITNKGQKK